MSIESDRNIVEQYNAMCRRAEEGDPSARAVKFIIDAVLEDKLAIDQLRMISNANKKDVLWQYMNCS
ncbi:hypothetical protein [Brevibacillus brevis]|uniref:hypothetical protein n=1 Tax=Brevibacillus brevis TaxID=1393 RepID=UPI003D1BDCCC